MEKYYQVKVYDQTNDYITTWADVVSDIEFNNEINSAGGQLQLTLARNAGDYGEGTDVNFGYKVQVYCFDTEEPNGLLIFQGYISAYTPIYKDDKVQVTVLGYGSELNDYIIEAGDTAYLSQTLTNKTFTGYADWTSQFNSLAQTFTLPANKTISSVDLMVTTTASDNFYVQLKEMVGIIPDHYNDPDLASGNISITGAVSGEIKRAVFNENNALVTGKTYYIEVWCISTSKVHGSNTNPYANGRVYEDVWGGTAWVGYSATGYNNALTANDDFYFVINEFGGNTTAAYTSQEPTAILTDLIANYQSRGGALIEPLPILEPLIYQPFKSITVGAGTWATGNAQIFISNKTTTIDTIQFYTTGGGPDDNIYIYQGDPSTDFLDVISSGEVYTLGVGNTLVATSENFDTTQGTSGYIYYTFANPITLQANTQYYILQHGVFSNMPHRAATDSDVLPDTQVGKLYRAEVNANNTGSAFTYNSTYKALYFDLLYLPDGFPANANGGYIPTDTTVSYTYKVNTILEGINILKDLAPENWYWYIDQGSNELEFKEKSDEPQHFFSLQKDLIDAKFEKRTEDIVNTVYFTGGAVSPGVNYYKKYIDANSISLYGVKSIKYSDSNVTTDATADLIGNNIIATKSQPELRVALDILDSNNNQGVGYDIESLQVGDVIAVRNITQQVGLSSWDIGKWDDAYWDFNIYNLSSLRMQIQKIEYKADRAIVYASTIPIDVNKRIEQVNRSLQALQTVNNPTAPS